tara:strand:- start:22239 stop:22442 length:204 start_codon:yes stop_codon:yes gene_type:complete
MKLLHNPFKKKNNGIWKRLNVLGNFTWSNKKQIIRLEHKVNELQLILENKLLQMQKPAKRGRPKKNA